MNINSSDEYYMQKKALLKQCLDLSEELISSLDDWESLSDILSRREAVILEIKELESLTGKTAPVSISKERLREIDRLIKLILDLDNDTSALIRKEQEHIMNSIKANIQGQKLMQYTPAPELKRGMLLDYKK